MRYSQTMPETQKRRIGTCAHCVRPEIKIHARELCSRCYQSLGGFGGKGRARQAPDPMFAEYATRGVSPAERAEDYVFMRRTEGATVELAAMRMGIPEKTLRTALWRAGVKP